MSKNYQLNIIKKIKKDCRKKLVKVIKIFLKKKKKKRTIWLQTLQKSLIR